MAKRARGSTTRPGQRPRLQRSAARPAAPATAPVTRPVTRPVTLTAEEEARAAELEAAIVAEEHQAEATQRRSRTRATEAATPRPTSSLQVSAEQEYAYVARDVRRIALVGGSLVALLFGMWIVAHIIHFGPF